MSILLTVIVTFFAGMGAGLGTGFAGMSAAAVISPMLITFLGNKVLAVNTRKVKTLVYKTVALCTSGSIFANVFLRFLFPKHIKIIQIYSSDFLAYMIIVFLLCAGMIGLKEKRT